MAGTRCRYRDGVDRLVETVVPFAVEPGWFVYAEDGKHPVQKTLLLKYRKFLRALYDLSPQLAFTQSDMDKCMKKILDDSDWPLDGRDRKEQPRILASRVRAACRHCAQALRKKSPPKWAMTIFGGKKADLARDEEKGHSDADLAPLEHDSVNDDGAGEDDEDNKWIDFGWDPELFVAWRAYGAGRKRVRQVTKHIFEPTSANRSDSMLARFEGDEKLYHISDLTVDCWRKIVSAQKLAKARTNEKPKLWSAMLPDGRGELFVKQRPDRVPLVSLFHNKCQICQVPEGAFATVQKAVDFLAASSGCQSFVGLL